jgi:hypothetical protein
VPFRSTYTETFKLLGFAGIKDLLASALGLKSYSWGALKIYLLTTSVAAVGAFCTHWIWNPPSALFLLLFLDLANARYGYLVAKKLKGQGFRLEEFQRTFGKLLATIIVLTIVRNAINAYSYYELLADAVFAWLFTTKTQKVVSKMVTLKVSEEGLPNVFKAALRALLNSKLGPLLVDKVQQHGPPEAAAETVHGADSPSLNPEVITLSGSAHPNN